MLASRQERETVAGEGSRDGEDLRAVDHVIGVVAELSKSEEDELEVRSELRLVVCETNRQIRSGLCKGRV